VSESKQTKGNKTSQKN